MYDILHILYQIITLNLISHKKTPANTADVYVTEKFEIQPQETKVIPVGFGIELPDGCNAHFQTRTSMVDEQVKSDTRYYSFFANWVNDENDRMHWETKKVNHYQ